MNLATISAGVAASGMISTFPFTSTATHGTSVGFNFAFTAAQSSFMTGVSPAEMVAKFKTYLGGN